jgi:hypothetical protein
MQIAAGIPDTVFVPGGSEKESKSGRVIPGFLYRRGGLDPAED